MTYAADMGTACTYQGELFDNGTAVDGQDCDFQFSLWDDAAAGNMVAGPIAQAITVTGGRFTTTLDFGDGAITGQARWLKIEVCCASPC